MACVNLPAFPLQLLIQRHPEWKDHPAAVVDKDKPQGVILWVNKQAFGFRILPGMRYAKGLSLAPDLRAGVVSRAEIQDEVDELTERLRFFTPDIEPAKNEPGVFWLNASGLSLLYPSLKKWAGLIGADLTRAGFHWSMAVGFSRYASYAIARTGKKITVFEDTTEERAAARAVAIVRLGFPPDLRDALAQLGITTLGGFVDLPEDGIRKRFGDAACELYKLARGELFTPLDSRSPEEPFTETRLFDHPINRVERLMPVIEKMLDSIRVSLQARNQLIGAVTLSLALDDGAKRNEHLRPARATVDTTEILKLVELRLHGVAFSRGVVEITLTIDPAGVLHKQLELFARKPRRDLEAIERAFAQLRAEFGNHAVMRARLRDGHLPEACYEWEPMEKIAGPEPRRVQVRHLVRRIFARSVALLSWSRWRANGEVRLIEDRDHAHGGARLVGGHRRANDSDVVGPYIVSGGWWMRKVHREYYFVRNSHGSWLWIYYDRRRKRSFVQGAIE